MRLHVILDAHPELFGVTANAGEGIHDPALAQVQFWIVALVHLLSCLLYVAKVHFDLLSIDNRHMVFAMEDGPRHICRSLI